MTIKNLLLGFVATITIVSGAHAADVGTVTEPEFVEYVRVCDTYGAGYFYIPGTETCLRIGGYIQYDVRSGKVLGITGLDRKKFNSHNIIKYNDTWKQRLRLGLQTKTASETELGTLRTFIETRFFWNTDQGPTVPGNPPLPAPQYKYGAYAENTSPALRFAYIELAGLRLGKDESAFDTFVGYAGNVMQDDWISFGPANYNTNLISYTFSAGGGFSALVSLEQGEGQYTIDSYTPHVVGGIKFAQGWGGISAVIGYDSNVREYAVKVRGDLNIADGISLFASGGWQSKGSPQYYQQNFYAPWAGDWALWVGASAKLHAKATFNTQVSYDKRKELYVAANVAYEFVPHFMITPEVLYKKNSQMLSGNTNNVWNGMIRFQRSF